MEEDIPIDPELWLQYLMAVLPDEQEREKLIQKLSAASGIPPEKVELTLQAMVEYFLKETRKN